MQWKRIIISVHRTESRDIYMNNNTLACIMYMIDYIHDLLYNLIHHHIIYNIDYM